MSERLPWSKFTWSHWETDPALMLVSMGAQGFWMRLLCIAVKEGGFVLIGGEKPSAEKLAKVVRSTPDEVVGWLSELAAENVYSVDRRGVIYSRRIVRDEKKMRASRRNGKLGGNPNLRKTTDIPPSDNPTGNPPLKADKKEKKKENRIEKITPPPPRGTSASFDKALAAYPEAGRASTKPGLAEPEWYAACEVETDARMLASVAAFSSSPYAKAGDGRRVPSFQNWLRHGQYGAWLPVREAPWAGPAELRAAIVVEKGEPWAKAYLDHCAWRDLPERTLVTTSRTIAGAMQDLSAILAEHRIAVALEQASA